MKYPYIIYISKPRLLTDDEFPVLNLFQLNTAGESLIIKRLSIRCMDKMASLGGAVVLNELVNSPDKFTDLEKKTMNKVK